MAGDALIYQPIFAAPECPGTPHCKLFILDP
jgi:hypothetical protein